MIILLMMEDKRIKRLEAELRRTQPGSRSREEVENQLHEIAESRYMDSVGWAQ